jgi:hypothetical protein
LKSYTTWAETRVSHGIFVGTASAAADGVGAGLAPALELGEALAVDDLVGFGLEVVLGCGTHPASPRATVAASATTITLDRSRESAMVFMV